MTPERVKEIREVAEKARKALAVACDTGRVAMSVPVRPDHDTDVPIAGALNGLDELLDELVRLWDEMHGEACGGGPPGAGETCVVCHEANPYRTT